MLIYEVARGDGRSIDSAVYDLEAAVYHFIKAGYEPQGSFSMIYLSQYFYCTQAMVFKGAVNESNTK